MNVRRSTYGAAALALLLGACGGDDPNRTAYEQLDVVADTSEAYASEEAAPVTPVQSGTTVDGPLTVTGNFEGIADDAPPGSIVVSESGPGTLVSVKIDRYAPGSELKVSFTTGACDVPGETVYTLDETLTVGSEGFATLDTQIPVETRALLDGEHSVRLNTPGQGPPEIVLACAELPAAPLNELQRAVPGVQDPGEGGG